MRILGDTDTQDVRAIGGEFPGGLVPHAAAQVILVRMQAYPAGLEACLKLAGFQAIIKNQRTVGFGQPQEMAKPAFLERHGMGQMHLVF